MVTCTEGDCGKPAHAKQLCAMHYNRLRRNGSLVLPGPKNWQHAERVREAHQNWKGDGVNYNGIHARLRRYRGPAFKKVCVDCGALAHHWSYDGNDPDERRSESGLVYSVKMNHYEPRCRKCHSTFDDNFPTRRFTPKAAEEEAGLF